MSWGSPWLLCLLVLVPLGWLYLAFVKKPPVLVVPSVRPFRRRSGGRRFRNPALAEYLALAALTLLIAALARPRVGSERLIVRSEGVDMVLALDMSGSMGAYDLPPETRSTREVAEAIRSGRLENRFDTAKRELERFAAERPGDRIGLVGFADFAYRFLPPTTDRQLLDSRLRSLKLRQIGDGTNLAAPIVSAVNRLKSAGSPRRVLVLFTDGVDNVGYRVTPQRAAELAKECGVTIHTVGIGTPRAVAVVRSPFGTRLQPVPGEFDEALLRRIAEATGGKYFHAGSREGLRKVMDEIDALERTEKSAEKFVEYREYAPLLALAALLLAAAGITIGHTWKLRLP
jgi:Ca-activated chloride channel family protein